MKIALAALGFINENITYNLKVIKDTLIKYAKEVDLILFPEAFLQGFYACTFDLEHDKSLALSVDSNEIKEIADLAKELGVAVSFGLFLKEKAIYSAQIMIDENGNIIDIYKRVSEGWKIPNASNAYQEGNSFSLFNYKGYNFVTLLCGDYWYAENIEAVKKLHPDCILWPVYTDFNYQKWNDELKFAYLEQAMKITNKVVYVNAYCLDKEAKNIARGGACYFKDGVISAEISAGKEGVLVIEL